MNDMGQRRGRPGSDLWKEQEALYSLPGMEEIRRRAGLSKRRERLERLSRIAAAAAGLLGCAAMVLLGEHPLRVWLWAAAIASYFVLLIQFPEMQTAVLLSRGLVGLGLASEPAPCLDFYRRRLEARLEVSRAGVLWMLVGGLGGSVLFLLSLLGEETRDTAFLHLALATGSLVLYLRARREAPEIRRELENLGTYSNDLDG